MSVYSREERMKAIELYIKYDNSIAAVIRELGYPSRGLLPRWYKAYLREKRLESCGNDIQDVRNFHQRRRKLLQNIILSMVAIYQEQQDGKFPH